MATLTNYQCGCKTSASSCSSCCGESVQPAPAPCCECHETILQFGMCLYPFCTVVATTGTFYLEFSNACNQNIPINANELFFYHPTAGFMQITGYDGTSYAVQLVDQSRAGMQIEKGDCVLLSAVKDTSGVPPSVYCLTGYFTVPAVGTETQIYILNGAAIPVGATITFVWEGQSGSYLVTGYVSVSENVYTYTVKNTEDGHTVGTTIQGDCCGATCNVPIQVSTTIDFCDLPTTTELDTITGCLNESPRALVPEGEDFVPIGALDDEDNLYWSQRRLLDTSCCVSFSGCIVFSGGVVPPASQTIEVNSTNIECFEDIWAEVNATDQSLPMNIDGFPVLAIDYNPSTHTLTLIPAADELEETISFCGGGQICLGDCCSLCSDAIQNTDIIDGNIGLSLVPPSPLIVPSGETHWLIGLDYATGALTILEVDAAYIASGAGNGPKYPRITDPLVFRQKVCNTSPKGCDQLCKVGINYTIAFDPMPESMTIDWEVGHFAQGSATLIDGVTPNPYSDISTQEKDANTLFGPSRLVATLYPAAFGTDDADNNKVYPFVAGHFEDEFPLRKNNCAMSICWMFITINHSEVGDVTLNSSITIRRRISKSDWNEIAYPANPVNQEGFNGV